MKILKFIVFNFLNKSKKDDCAPSPTVRSVTRGA